MKSIRKLLSRSIWNIGFIDIKGTNDLFRSWDIHQLKHNEKRWFADPFILEVTDDEIFVLVEEMDYNRDKGRIACLRVNRATYELKEYKILLELKTHLSFPAIIRVGDEILVYPENSESGHLSLYKYDFKNNKLVEIKELVDQPLTDAIYYNNGRGEYILSSKQPDPNGNILHVYKKGVNGVFDLIQSISFNDNTARNAGDIFSLNGSLIRPAQNCNGYYGVGIVFQETSIDSKGFCFNEIGRVNVPKGYNGMHTFNTYKGVTVIDLRKPVYPVIHATFLKLKKTLKK